MVAHRHLSSPRIPQDEESLSPSALVHDDEDSGILGNNIRIGFPSPDEGHLIHDLLNNRSWMKEDVRTDEMEDDELEKEMEMLALAEKEVFQEISDIQRSFHSRSNQSEEESERGRRKLYSAPTPTINEIEIEHTEKLEWLDTNCVFQEQRDSETTNQKPMKVLSFKRKTHANISNIHEVETDMIERDARDSANESQPSDEACYGVYSICNRDPPEAILFVDDDESQDDDDSHDDYFDAIGNIVHHMSVSVSEDESVAGSAEMYSLKDKENFNESPLVEWHGEEEEDPRSGRLSDLETRGNDNSNLFREEMFVGDIVHTNSNITGDESAQGSAERHSPDAQQDDYINELSRVERRGEEEELDDAMSQLNLRSNRQLSDLEQGKSNVFEEEIFWEESFWRAQRVCEPEPRDPATLVRKDNRNTTTTKPTSGKSSIPSISGSRRSIIDILSLPTLEPRRDESEGIAATLDLQSIQSIPGESAKSSVHISTERISQMESNHTNNNESIHKESSAQIFDHTIDDPSLICIEEKKNNCSFIPLDPAVLIDKEEEEAVAINKRRCQNRKDSCDLRRIIIAVHVLLALSGVIVFWKFLLPTQGS